MHILDQEIVFDAGSGNAHRIDFLEGIRANHRGRDLAGQDHHGNGIHVGSGNPGDGIGRTGARGDQDNPGFAGGAGIAVSGMGGTLLMANQDVAYILLLEQGVIYMEYGPAGVPEDVFDPFVLQKLDKDIRAV